MRNIPIYKLYQLGSGYNIFTIILIIFFIYNGTITGQNLDGQSDSKTILVDNQIKSMDYITDLFETKEVILLQSLEDAYIKSKSVLKIRRDTIFILGDKTIKAFLNDGTFLTTIGEPGRGPGELMYAMDLTLPENNSEIHVLDNHRKSIVRFDNTGEYLGMKYIPLQYISHAQWIEGNNYLVFTYLPQMKGISYSVYLFNMVNKNLKGLLEMPEIVKSMSIMDYNYVSSFEKNVYVRIPLDNTIYLFKDELLYPYYNIKFKSSHAIQKNSRKSNNIQVLQGQIMKDGIPVLTMFHEFEDHYYIVYREGRDTYGHIIDKKSGAQKRYSRNNEEDILSKTLPITSADGNLIGIIEPALLLLRHNLAYSKQATTFESLPWIDIFPKLTPENNTLILFYGIKQE